MPAIQPKAQNKIPKRVDTILHFNQLPLAEMIQTLFSGADYNRILRRLPTYQY
jgi:hypothetical protein